MFPHFVRIGMAAWLCALLAAPSLAADEVDLKVGELLVQARQRLIKSGWLPFQMHQHDEYEYSGAEKALKLKGIVEVDTCSTDAGVRCIFYYEKNQQCLRIDTVGERIGDMTVTRWNAECPTI